MAIPPHDAHVERELRLLSELAHDGELSQRHLSRRLGIALGLTNLLLKRLIRKGYIKVVRAPKHRFLYLLTPQGFAHKARLTTEYLAYSVRLYREVRRALRAALEPLAGSPHRRVVLYGTGEAAELAYVCVRELELELAAIVDEGAPGRTFLGLPVAEPQLLPSMAYDRVIVATFDGAEAGWQRLYQLGVPAEKIISLAPGRLGGIPV
jgi:DNA-binding MarR family transcriptional regulator